jgi:UDP-N-acetylmuramoyl-L-alanyl-D-glutamate--2,6-diaminopimelate ligase
MLLDKIINGLEVEEIKGNINVEISGIAYDSRKVKKDFIFVCIDGKTVDGHKFVTFAIENGSKVLLVQKEVDVPEGITVIKVKDTRLALAFISDTFYGHPSGKFKLIGITGTKGKTTTTYMIKAILEKSGQKVGLVGTLGSRIGDEYLATERTTPESLDLQSIFDEMNEKYVNSVVMEVSSQGLALNRVTGCEYEIGVFTNITQDHIGPKEHLTFEDYLEAKKKLFKMCKKGLINIDAKYSKDIIKNAECEILTYGIDNDADIKAEEIEKYPDGVTFKVITPWFSGFVKVGMPGKFSIYNALAAIGVCGLMGVPFEAAKAGLEKISVPGRAEVIYSGDDFTILTDYAHTPDSFENILSTFKAFAPGRLVCVFGCGGDRDKSKRPVMAEIASRLADFTIITSDNPRTEEPIAIINDIEKGIIGSKAEYITIIDRREAIKYTMENFKPKDIIILAGKGDETYQIFGTKQIHFDEREVVKEILEELRNLK